MHGVVAFITSTNMMNLLRIVLTIEAVSALSMVLGRSGGSDAMTMTGALGMVFGAALFVLGVITGVPYGY